MTSITLRNLSRKTIIRIAVVSLAGLSLCFCILVVLFERPLRSSPLLNKVELLSKFQTPRWTKYDKSFGIENIFIGDNTADGPIYICRANHGFEVFYQDIEIMPGVYDAHRNVCIIFFGQSAYEHTDFELLSVKDQSSLIWVQASSGEIPVGSVIAGMSITDDEVPIAKLHYKGTTWIGVVQVRHGIAYATFDGLEVEQPYYHILSLRDISL